MKVLAFTKYDSMGASTRVRLLTYFDYFSSVEFDVNPLFDNDYLQELYHKKNRSKIHVFRRYLNRFGEIIRLLFKPKVYDVIWIEKELFPWVPLPIEYVLKVKGFKIVFDYDDAVYHNYDNYRLFDYKFKALARLSDGVICGNQYLKNYFKKQGAKSQKLVPTVVEAQKFKPVQKAIGSQLVIGWIGSPSTQRYLYLVEQALTELYSQHEFELRLIGVSDDFKYKVDYTRVNWSSESEINEVCNFDIGIMPLPNNPFEKGKCGYKIIQYFAASAPVCASSVGVNRSLVEDGVNGYLCQSSDSWYESLESLLSNANIRKQMGSSGRNKIEKEFTYSSQYKIIEDYLFEIVGCNNEN